MADRFPLVTVIAVCFNHERFVVECLDSIRAQTYPNVQLIIADDHSSDDSVAVITGWLRRTGTDATVLCQETNQGLCRIANLALAHARGSYVSLLSTDDSWLPHKLSDQVAQLERLPSTVGVAYSDAIRMDGTGKHLEESFLEHGPMRAPPEGDIYETLCDQNFISAPATLVRRACYEEVGTYDESLLYEDWDMWLRIAQRFEFVFTPRAGACYRFHADSLTHLLTNELGGFRWWDSNMRIFLKHAGHRAATDSILWDRIARAAYRLDDPDFRRYARANVRANRTTHAVALYLLCLARVPHRRVTQVKRAVARIRGARRQDRAPAAGSPTETAL